MQDALQARDAAFPAVLPTYARSGFAAERGKGMYLYDQDGFGYLDFTSGIGVTALGHCHPHLVDALKKQAETLWHCSNVFRIPGQEKLAERLVAATFADTVFFGNSGAEAWECGLKMIRRYFHAKGQPERNRIITMENAFHGRTLASISATKRDALCEGFAPLLEGFDIVPFNDLEAVEKAITPETAAIHLEPIQGEGGIIVAGDDYLKGLRALADKHGLLLFFDEIQCGMGRTGRLFAHEWSGVTPDVMCIAKGLGGGFPVGACLATAEAACGMGIGAHGSTFGGNPLAMAAGNAVLDVVLEDGFLDHVNDMAGQLQRALEGLIEKHPKVLKLLRGRGLMLGLQCQPGISNLDLLAALRERKLLCVKGSDNIVRMLPALVLESQDIAQAIEIIDESCTSLDVSS